MKSNILLIINTITKSCYNNIDIVLSRKYEGVVFLIENAKVFSVQGSFL